MASRVTQPDVSSYNAMLQASATRGDDVRANSWFQLMLEQGLQPNKASYDSMIQACATMGKTQEAEKWVFKMVRDGFEPNHKTLMSLDCAGRLAIASTRTSRLWAYGCIIKASACGQKSACMKRWIDVVVEEEGSMTARALCERVLSNLGDSSLEPIDRGVKSRSAQMMQRQNEPSISTLGVTDLTSRMSEHSGEYLNCEEATSRLHESQRMDIQIPQPPIAAVVEAPSIVSFRPPPGLEGMAMSPPFAKMTPCVQPYGKPDLEKCNSLAAHSLETLPTQASGCSPLTSPRSDSSEASIASVFSLAPSGMRRPFVENFASQEIPLAGVRISL